MGKLGWRRGRLSVPVVVTGVGHPTMHTPAGDSDGVGDVEASRKCGIGAVPEVLG